MAFVPSGSVTWQRVGSGCVETRSFVKRPRTFRRPSFQLPTRIVTHRAQPMLCTKGDKPSPTDDTPLADESAESTLVQEPDALDIESGNAVLVQPDPRIPAVCFFLGGFLVYQDNAWTLLGYPLLAIGALLFFQLTRVRFVFGPTKLNVAYKKGDSLEFVRGWAYNKIVNWEFYPSPKFPILAYYREIESYAGRGSIHFIPCVFDAQQMFQLFEKSAPKQSKSE